MCFHQGSCLVEFVGGYREMARFSLGELIGTFTQKNPKVTLKSADDTDSQSNSEGPKETSESIGPAEADSPERQEKPAPLPTDRGTI